MSLLERLRSHQTASGSGLVQHSHRLPCPHHACGPWRAQQRSSSRQAPGLVCSSSRTGSEPTSSPPAAAEAPSQQQRIESVKVDPLAGAEVVKTRYIAETLLPTRHGKFRLRGYKHSVSRHTQAWLGWDRAGRHNAAAPDLLVTVRVFTVVTREPLLTHTTRTLAAFVAAAVGRRQDLYRAHCNCGWAGGGQGRREC